MVAQEGGGSGVSSIDQIKARIKSLRGQAALIDDEIVSLNEALKCAISEHVLTEYGIQLPARGLVTPQFMALVLERHPGEGRYMTHFYHQHPRVLIENFDETNGTFLVAAGSSVIGSIPLEIVSDMIAAYGRE